MDGMSKGLIGCFAVLAAFIVLIAAASIGGGVAVGIAFAAIALAALVAALAWYVPGRKARQANRRAERALRKGEICDGLRHFWRVGNIERIRRCIDSQLKLPERGLGDWWNKTDAPKFKGLIKGIFEQMVALRQYMHLPANSYLPADLKAATDHQLTRVADCVWEIAQRLSVLAQSGVRANDAVLRDAFKEMEQTLNSFSRRVGEIQNELRKYVSAPHRYDTLVRQALTGLDEVVNQMSSQEEFDKEVKEIEKQLSEGGKSADQLMDEVKARREKEAIPRKQTSE